MTRRIAQAVLVAGALALGCSGVPPAPHGAPVLIAVYWVAGGSRYLVSSPSGPTDPALIARAPAYASEVDFVFNRRLDGVRIEDTVTVDGVATPRSKPDPPITASWP